MSSEVAEVVSENNQHDAAEAKGKKGLGKKLTALERTTQEGEALLKEMGYKEDGEDQGRRRTRSGARPAAVASPPPAKKEKKTPKKTPKATPGTGRRGRPPKKTVNDSSTENEDSEVKEDDKAEEKEDEKEEVSSTEEAKSDTKPTEEAAKEEKKEEKEAEKETKKENNDAAAVIEPVKEKENLLDKEESKASD